ncbi:hypothetical protein OF83DRAFT_1166763 [Amylostereum chailletii]|nr:hypothetical protein OF83DRAFT_1166763 [Amylostereum chailletii]
MGFADSFDAKDTTVEFTGWPADVTGLERVMLTARGDLQRLLSAYFNHTITIQPIFANTSPQGVDMDAVSPTNPVTQHRQVHLLCSKKVTCVATSTVRVTSPPCAKLFLEDKFAIGQMFRKLRCAPKFTLCECGAERGEDGKRTLRRRYLLTTEGFECDIVEEFPDRDMFDRGAAWLDTIM